MFVVEGGRHEPLLQSENAGRKLHDPAARTEMAEVALGCGDRQIAEFPSDRPGLDPIHLHRAHPVGVDVAHLLRTQAGCGTDASDCLS